VLSPTAGRPAAEARWSRQPSIGRRPVVALTCNVCHQLLPGARFGRNGRGYVTQTCHTCTSRRWREAQEQRRLDARQRADYARASATRLPDGRRHGQVWTGPELEHASRADLTARQVAVDLGRSVFAVRRMRHLMTTPARGSS
jgi:hypothetical protein